MSDDRKAFNRDNKGEDYKGSQKSSVVDKEVADLFKGNVTNEVEMRQRLKQKFPNDSDLVEAISDSFKERLKNVMKRARKFKELLLNRYSHMNIPFSEMMKKAKKYQKKYNIDPEEFQMFLVLALTDKSSPYYKMYPFTKMAKTLGYDTTYLSQSKMNVPADDVSIISEIINKMYIPTRPLHAQVILQTNTYRDCAPEALVGKYDHKKMNPYAYVHPVIGALFFPKVRLLDHLILYANIGYIIKQKFEGKPILTKPDNDLYWFMVTDPAEDACSFHSAAQDLKNRFELQTRLWEAILKIRMGQYYYDKIESFTNLMTAFENCRSNIYDAPDLTYVRDEGTLLRRILHAFSIRPTMVTTNKLFGVLSGAEFGFPNSPYDIYGISNITTVPMITLRLPLQNLRGSQNAISLEDALTQPQWFVENGVIVPKAQQLLHSEDVLFFYVGRRYQHISVTRLNMPYNFSRLPMTVNGWEKLNEAPVYAPPTISLTKDIFELRSVVCVEKMTRDNKSIITGSSAIIISRQNAAVGSYDDTFYLYDPQGSSERFLDNSNNYVINEPITVIPNTPSFYGGASRVESYEERARERGTIFMYQKKNFNWPC